MQQRRTIPPSAGKGVTDSPTSAERFLRDAVAGMLLFVAVLSVYLADTIISTIASESNSARPAAAPAAGEDGRADSTTDSEDFASPWLTPIAAGGPDTPDDEGTANPAAKPRPAAPPKPQLTFEKHVAPFFRKHCTDCHSGDTAEAGMQVEKFISAEHVTKHRKQFEKILRYVRGGIMPPPADAERPPQADRDKFVAYLDDELFNIDCIKNRDPGRVTIRRLNRNEYNNTIRDLVGVDFKPAKDFPADDVGYGFDNIGDVLSLPTLLMEKYLAAAEQITEQAIVAEPASLLAKRYGAGDTAGGNHRGDFRGLFSSGHVTLMHEFTKKGEYVVRVHAFGDQAGPEPAKMQFSLDGKRESIVEVPNRRGQPKSYETKFEADAGRRRVSLTFLNDYYQPDHKDPKLRGDRNLWIGWVEVQGPLGGKAELPETHAHIITCTPGGGRSVEDCAREILRNFAPRAWRRPVEEVEIERLVRFVKMAEDNGETFEQGIQLAVQAVLVSPNFLFKVELDPRPDDANSVRTLNEHELAVRLSYFLWSSMPDEELFRHAAADTLRNNLPHQVRRMIADAKADAFVRNFAGQWLQLRNLNTVSPDPKRFSAWNPRLRDAMRNETELFFAHVMREDRSVFDLLDAEYTFLNERLAKHYGIDGVQGEEFREVSLQTGARGGVLTQASVLTVTSDPTRTSPVKRGKWILENILGREPPPPPPNIEELKDDGKELTGTLRQRMEQHRRNANCAVCHTEMDQLGFGFENFDAIGGWRDREGKFPVDASGELPGGKKFDGPGELKAVLSADKDGFRRCLAEKMLTYALGRGLEYYDRCWVDEITKKLADGDDKFGALVMAIVESDAFQKRKRREPAN